MSKSHNRQVAAYTDEKRSLKYHEQRMLDIIKSTFPATFQGNILDVGCASGSFLQELVRCFNEVDLSGLEYSEELLEIAHRRLADSGVELHQGDAATWDPAEKQDLVIASAILSVFEDPLPVLTHWLGWLKPEGCLYIFGRFNSKNIDTRVFYRNHFEPHGWETGFTSYAIDTIRSHVEEAGFTVEFERFVFPEQLDPSENPIRHYTLPLANGSPLMVNGANVIAEQFFALIRRK